MLIFCLIYLDFVYNISFVYDLFTFANNFVSSAYAKQQFNPKLTDEAGTLLTQSYVKMRQIGSGRGQITAYPRQLESLIRLAEAHARMRFSHTVEVVDVEEATRLQREVNLIFCLHFVYIFCLQLKI